MNRKAIEEDKFVSPGTYSVMRRNIMMRPMHPVTVIRRLRPIAGGLSAKVRTERPSLHLLRSFHAGIVQKSRRKIDVVDYVVINRISLDLLWIADKERHPQGLFEHPPLIDMVMLAKKHTLVTRINNNRIFGEVVLIEIIKQPAHVIVDRCHATQIILKIALIRCPGYLLFGHACHIQLPAWPPVVLHALGSAAYLVLRRNRGTIITRTVRTVAFILE